MCSSLQNHSLFSFQQNFPLKEEFLKSKRVFDEEGILYVDMPQAEKPKRLRVVYGAGGFDAGIKPFLSNSLLNSEIINLIKSYVIEAGYLGVSSSGQFCRLGFSYIKRALPSSLPLLVIDLRQETHILVRINNVMHNVRLHSTEDNDANKHLTTSAILTKEGELVEKVKEARSVILYHDSGKKLVSPKEVTVSDALTEEEMLAESARYIRIPETDHSPFSESTLAVLMKVIDTYKDTHWIHFHCHAGRGRAKNAFVHAVMKENAKHFSFEDFSIHLERFYDVRISKEVKANIDPSKRERKLAKAKKKIEEWQATYQKYRLFER